ncbi:MAG: hypothetical protein Ct9H300mP27_11350 [Chloroflexota bacterium]|nr:MAG: hypothetical protein Ct9H300mP27_11350 [Chloroflexota bacterium]
MIQNLVFLVFRFECYPKIIQSFILKRFKEPSTSYHVSSILVEIVLKGGFPHPIIEACRYSGPFRVPFILAPVIGGGFSTCSCHSPSHKSKSTPQETFLLFALYRLTWHGLRQLTLLQRSTWRNFHPQREKTPYASVDRMKMPQEFR